jgi:hypothetical protein
VTRYDPHKEEDEGYLAAEGGQRIDRNPYPPGTLRHDHWRRGWHMRQAEIQLDRDAAGSEAVGARLADNPHPPGTIRYAEWRRTWLTKHGRGDRAARLALKKE